MSRDWRHRAQPWFALEPWTALVCVLIAAYVIARAVLVPLTYDEAADLLGVVPRTVQRRLDRGLRLLTERLGDLGPGATSPGPS